MLTSPLSFTWADLVDTLVAERGSLAELVRALYEVHPGELPPDPLTVERGLRRLRSREVRSGDKYGRMLVRNFGLPLPIQTWARELGQYHSRLSELSLTLRRDQLRLWDRPPVSESAEAAWIHIALASLAHADADTDALARRLELAALGVGRAGIAARLELDLFRARLATDAGDLELAERRLAAVATCLSPEPEPAEFESGPAESGPGDLGTYDRACLDARRLDQLAYLRARGWRGHPDRLTAAERVYREIPARGPAFVVFRRHQGLAWCLWRRGEPPQLAQRHVELAAQAAGDGGFLHLRRLALRLHARIVGPGEVAEELERRAGEILRSLEGGLDR